MATRPLTFINEADPLGPPADPSTATAVSAGNLNTLQDGLVFLSPADSTRNVIKRSDSTADGQVLFQTQLADDVAITTDSSPHYNLPAGSPGFLADDQGNVGFGENNLITNKTSTSDLWDWNSSIADFMYRARERRIASRHLTLTEVNNPAQLFLGYFAGSGTETDPANLAGTPSGQAVGAIRFRAGVTPLSGTVGVTGGAFFKSWGAEIFARAAEDQIQSGASTYQQGMGLRFATTAIGTAGPPTVKMALSSEGQLQLGSSLDVNWYRDSNDVWGTDDSLVIKGSAGVTVQATSSPAFKGQQTASNYAFINFLLSTDSQPAFRVRGNGRIDFGAGGSTAPDVDLLRPAADQLKTDDQFIAVDGITTKVVAGAVSDTSFTATPGSGTLAVDTTNSKLYVRVGSTWKSVALA